MQDTGQFYTHVEAGNQYVMVPVQSKLSLTIFLRVNRAPWFMHLCNTLSTFEEIVLYSTHSVCIMQAAKTSVLLSSNAQSSCLAVLHRCCCSLPLWWFLTLTKLHLLACNCSTYTENMFHLQTIIVLHWMQCWASVTMFMCRLRPKSGPIRFFWRKST